VKEDSLKQKLTAPIVSAVTAATMAKPMVFALEHQQSKREIKSEKESGFLFIRVYLQLVLIIYS
jgi:hypothetical protein